MGTVHAIVFYMGTDISVVSTKGACSAHQNALHSPSIYVPYTFKRVRFTITMMATIPTTATSAMRHVAVTAPSITPCDESPAALVIARHIGSYKPQHTWLQHAEYNFLILQTC